MVESEEAERSVESSARDLEASDSRRRSSAPTRDCMWSSKSLARVLSVSGLA